MNDVQININANKLAKERLAEIESQFIDQSPELRKGFQSVILDLCHPKCPGKVIELLPRASMIANVVARAESLHGDHRHQNDWKWEDFYVQFSRDCGIDVARHDAIAEKFASAMREVIGRNEYDLRKLRQFQDQFVDAILAFYTTRRETLTTPESLDGARLADDWIECLEVDVIALGNKGRDKFWEKVAESIQTWDL